MTSGRRTHYLISYDIENDRSRAKLSNLLLDYGERVQYSVFEADLSRKDVQEILTKAANLVQKQDSLRIYPICEACRKAVRTKGRAVVEDSRALRII